ncbi:hypothetical protein EG68_11107, partial [Paragonimus skrjabini miyazakii]
VLYSRDLAIIYKPVQKPPKGPHEVAFYQRVFASDCVDPVLLELRSFLPTYKGVYRDPSNQTLYLGLSDLLSGLHHPTICDIKVGRQTYTPDASEEKRATELAKYKWQDQLGFCISGMQIVDHHSEHRLVHLNREFGRSLDPSTVYDHGTFLTLFRPQMLTFSLPLFTIGLCSLILGTGVWCEVDHMTHPRCSKFTLSIGSYNGLTEPLRWRSATDAHHIGRKIEVAVCGHVGRFFQLVTALVNWFERQSQLSFYATSILLAYDGVPQQKNGLIVLHSTAKDSHSTTTSSPVIDFDSVVAHMVDFTRLRSLDGNRTTDENFLYGLRNLISLFSRAAAETQGST